MLLKDSWEYADEGILDKTHLRFYTYTSFIKLLEIVGLKVVDFYYELPITSKSGILNIITFGIFRRILTSHYYYQIMKI